MMGKNSKHVVIPLVQVKQMLSAIAELEDCGRNGSSYSWKQGVEKLSEYAARVVEERLGRTKSQSTMELLLGRQKEIVPVVYSAKLVMVLREEVKKMLSAVTYLEGRGEPHSSWKEALEGLNNLVLACKMEKL
jgi:hypothetical protein